MIDLPRHIKDKLNSNDLNAIDTLVEDLIRDEYEKGFDDGWEQGYRDGA